MKLDHYLTSLLPTFSKERVMEDCRLTLSELKDTSLPLYATAVKAFHGHKFKDEEIANWGNVFNRTVKGHKGSLLEGVESALEQTYKNLLEVEKLIDKVYNDEVASIGLSYLKANLLQFTEWASFASKYSRRLLIYILIQETAQYPDSGPTLSQSLEPAEIEWIKIHFIHFCTALTAVAQPTEKLKSAIAGIPDISITTDNLETLKASQGSAKVDPFSVGLIPVWVNPIYHIRMTIAEWRADRYRATKEEKKLVELRILNLKRAQDGKADTGVQKEIDYSQRRLSNINSTLDEYERKGKRNG